MKSESIKDAKATVIKEDKEGALFSLEQNKGEVLKLPTFAGEAGQDLVRFKKKIEYRFKSNQVTKQDHLKSQALRLIPEPTEHIDGA